MEGRNHAELFSYTSLIMLISNVVVMYYFSAATFSCPFTTLPEKYVSVAGTVLMMVFSPNSIIDNMLTMAVFQHTLFI